ncbi:MAG: undecaprenyldiphospho-muramoylpentapeptide beta-N-acetylglucosaminyltransferase, partial [Erysipelotrichaceae bacterium]|nr:undecaprenyldiphospho-muramoylpentapeptide beta-N-acetylglucosaminyltransferase [Erysipelotrichaceae bacterium]
MRVLMSAGGTGGHIYPALALADALKKEQHEIMFIGSKDRMEATLIPDAGYTYASIDVRGMNGNLIYKLNSARKLLMAERKCKKIIKDFRPDIVIGFGNYISVPVIRSAHRLGIKTMLHEQNSYPGKANLLLARYADAIVGCYEENLDQFPKDKCKILGNPRASLIKDVTKDKGFFKEFGLSEEVKSAVIMTGSLGSSSVNQVVEETLPLLDDYQCVVATGKGNYEDFKFKDTDKIKVVPYIDGLKATVNADLLVVRGGATTAAEVASAGVASIIIPSPYVPNNHQYINAKAFEDAKACVLIEEKNLTAKLLSEEMNRLMNEDDLRSIMGENAKVLGKP